MNEHIPYMRRCIALAALAEGNVAPNPLVGAVLVHNGLIIGEGFHEQYGGPHAEVNCISSVASENIGLVPLSTLYVSLEPCSHHGKTPPCTDLIIKNKIPHVVIGCRDPFKQVNGKGIEQLIAAGVKVETGILEKECRELNKRFLNFYEKQRPYIILKWAQSADAKISVENKRPVKISNAFTDRLVHKWRAEEAAILIGANTVIADDPLLTVRHWPGSNPVRIILDNELRTDLSAKTFNADAKTIVINRKKEEQSCNPVFFKAGEAENFKDSFTRCMTEQILLSVLVEGGAQTLQSFIDAYLWDEARIITNTGLIIGHGTAAPVLTNGIAIRRETIFTDSIIIYKNKENGFL